VRKAGVCIFCYLSCLGLLHIILFINIIHSIAIILLDEKEEILLEETFDYIKNILENTGFFILIIFF
jgi:hypothetical protein